MTTEAVSHRPPEPAKLPIYTISEVSFLTGLSREEVRTLTANDDRGITQPTLRLLLNDPQVKVIEREEKILSRKAKQSVWIERRVIASMNGDLDIFRQAASNVGAKELYLSHDVWSAHPGARFYKSEDIQKMAQWAKESYHWLKIIPFPSQNQNGRKKA